MNRLVVLGAALVAAATVVTAPAALAAGHTHPGGQVVTVTLKDYRIVSPQLRPAVFEKKSNLAPGATTFRFTNSGKFAHDFTIIAASTGATRFSSGPIKPGRSKTMSVNLKPGGYLAVYMQFNGFHYAAGMVKGFSVGQITEKGNWTP